MSDPPKNCPICKKEFGIFRHRYDCAACKQIFCDDCTPHKYVVPPHTDAERVCLNCEKQLGSTMKTKDGGRRLGGDAPPATADIDRDRRARAAEERAQATKIHVDRNRSKPSAPVTAPLNEKPAPAAISENVAGSSNTTTTQSNLQSDTNMSPVLAAAMKRQQQSKTTSGGGASSQNDPEKQQLLIEIQTLLKCRNEDEPFGLRAMDVTKLRLFLRHLREK